MKSHTAILTHIRKPLFILSLFLLPTLSLASCGSEETPSPTIDLDAEYTLAAQTVIAEMTRLAPTETLEPTEEPATLEIPPTATATITPSITPETTVTETVITFEGVPQLPDYKVVFDDNFSSGRGWYTTDDEDYGFRFTEQGYLIYVNILKATIWSIRDIELTDMRVEIIAEQKSGPNDGYYGVTCRHLDGDNYYALVISNNGQYGIAKMEQGDFEFIQEGTAPSGVIDPTGINHVIGDCIGDMLTLYANDKKLTEVQDSTFQSGVFGMVVGTGLHEGVGVEFTQILVMAP